MSDLGVVVIGRNEGERLRRCFESLPADVVTVYVDSGSTDDSIRLAEARGVAVVELDMSRPFTAARARNAGFAELLRRQPTCRFVQFVDGDCELAAGWCERCRDELKTHVDVAAVCGRLRERNAEASLYNRLCNMEWDGPTGDVDACGGIAMFRANAMHDALGFRDSLAAGEEPELCLRLRAAGWKIRRLATEMATHDAAMTRFGQWWTRAARAGWAFAECSRLHAGLTHRLWVRETRSLWFWGLLLPLTFVAGCWFSPLFALVLLYPALAVRVYRSRRRHGNCPSDASLYAVSCVVAKFAQVAGAIRYWLSPARSDARTSVAYLVNQYPHVSHSFIRREIRALTESGVRIKRYSIRRPAVALVDVDDRAELRQTEVLLDAGPLRLIAASLMTAAQSPIRWSRAAVLTIRMARRSGRGFHRHVAYLAEACLLVRRLRCEQVNHLHAHFGTNSTDVALLAHVLDDVPYSFTIHGPEEFDRPEALSLREKIANAAFVATVSEFGRSQAFRWCEPEHWRKIHVVHCGVDDDFLNARITPVQSTKHLVCVGRLCEQKGQMLLLQAFAVLDEFDARLTLAGDGPMREQLEAEIERLGLMDRVDITGWISNAQVRQLLRGSRAMVLPSFAEGLPLVLMEALSLGRPVVTTYVAGIPELVRPGINGWLVPAGSVRALADALRQTFSESPEHLTQMGIAGAAAVRRHHNARIEADKLAALLSVAKRPPHASKDAVAMHAAATLASVPTAHVFEGSRS